MSKEVYFDRDKNRFGHCGVEGHNNFIRNLRRDHWMCCDQCKLKWYIGSNLFSTWCDETEEDWRRNFEIIKEYEEFSEDRNCIFLDIDTNEEGLQAWRYKTYLKLFYSRYYPPLTGPGGIPIPRSEFVWNKK